MKKTKKTCGNLYNRRNQPIAWIFVSPFVIGVLTYFIYVIYHAISFSFSELSVGETHYVLTWLGIENYKHAILGDVGFLRLTVGTIGSMIYKTPIILLFSLLMAVFLNNNIPGRTVFRAIFFLPVVVSAGIITLADSSNVVLQTLSSSSGIDAGAGATQSYLSSDTIETFFSSLDFSPVLIGYVTDAVNNIINIVNQSGVQIIIFLAGLQSISPSIYEYAQTEGATGWEIFWKITFPLISPMMLVNLFYTVVDIVTSSNNEVLGYIKHLSFSKAEFGIASAMAWLYFLAVALIIVVVGIIILTIANNRKKDIL